MSSVVMLSPATSATFAEGHLTCRFWGRFDVGSHNSRGVLNIVAFRIYDEVVVGFKVRVFYHRHGKAGQSSVSELSGEGRRLPRSPG